MKLLYNGLFIFKDAVQLNYNADKSYMKERVKKSSREISATLSYNISTKKIFTLPNK